MKKTGIIIGAVILVAILCLITFASNNDKDNKNETSTVEVETSEETSSEETSSEEQTTLQSEKETDKETNKDTASETDKSEETTRPSETTTKENDTEETTTAPIETTKPEYTVTKLDKTMYAKSTVNVRKGPSTDFDKVGSLSAGKQVKVVGQSDQTGWYLIQFDGKEGYVSNSYLQDKPVETTTPKPTTTKKPSTTSGGGSSAEETTTKPAGDMSYSEQVAANPNNHKADKYYIAYNADGTYDVKNTIMGTEAGVSGTQREDLAYEIFMEKLADKLEVPEGWYLTVGRQRRYNDASTKHYDIRDYKLSVMKKVGEGYCWIFDENFNLKKVSLSETN